MRFLLCLCGLALAHSEVALAVQQEPPPREEPIPTLHVYENLIQIPTLVLDSERRPLKKPIAANRFSVSIDSGPWFRATHVRQEGDDPISLSILLDVSGDSSELMANMNTAIGDLAPDGLHAKDHVSIYSLDCSLVQSLNDMPAESERLKIAVNEALQTWMRARSEMSAVHTSLGRPGTCCHGFVEAAGPAGDSGGVGWPRQAQ